MENQKNNKGVIALLIVIIVILSALCVLFATGTITLKSNDVDNNETNTNNNDIYNNLTIVLDDNPNSNKVYTETIMAHNKNEVLSVSSSEIKLGNKQILKLEPSPISIRQVSVYNDIIITLQINSSIIIYDFYGNEIKKIGLFSDEQGRTFVSYPGYNLEKSFDLSSDGVISFVGTKHTQGIANTYINDNGNQIDLCTQGENIDDNEIVSGIFQISYLGNNNFSDIKYVSTKSIIKDIKNCN